MRHGPVLLAEIRNLSPGIQVCTWHWKTPRMTHIDSTYAKPFLTIPEQIRPLEKRGMNCGDATFATHVLERYGYYRLSGYWFIYRNRPVSPQPLLTSEGRRIRLDTFMPGTDLNRVVSLYRSDHELCTRIDAVLSIIEIAFRFLIGHRLGRIHPFAHRNPQILNAMRRDNSGCSPEPTTAYCKWLQEYNHDEAQAKDDFAIHFRKEYGPHLPIWVATEVMSFGVLSGLYGLMPEKDQSIIAARLQILTKDERGDRGTLMNWLNNLRITRNICAHYGRLWNRVLNILSVPGQVRNEPDSPLSSLLDNNANNHLYGILLIMRYLLLSIASENTDVLDIVDDIDKRLPQMGFSIRTIGSLKSGETIRFGINNSNSINHPCWQQVSLTALKA